MEQIISKYKIKCACCNKEIKENDDCYEHEYGRVFCSPECILKEGFYGHWRKLKLNKESIESIINN